MPARIYPNSTAVDHLETSALAAAGALAVGLVARRRPAGALALFLGLGRRRLRLGGGSLLAIGLLRLAQAGLERLHEIDDPGGLRGRRRGSDVVPLHLALDVLLDALAHLVAVLAR